MTPLRRKALLVVLPLLLGLIGCSSTRNEDQLIDQLANLDKETIFERAENLYGEKKYQEARELFSFVYDTFPNDPLGHKAALRIADTFAVKRDVTNLTEARLRYRDFANRYPNDPDRDYALLMVGNTFSARKLRPDRDLSDIEEALGAYQQLATLYPGSRYVSQAQSEIDDLLELRPLLAQCLRTIGLVPHIGLFELALNFGQALCPGIVVKDTSSTHRCVLQDRLSFV